MTTASHLARLTDEDRRALEAWLAEFERNWDERRLGVQVKALPADGPLRRAALLELVKADLRRQWQQGRHARVEAYYKALPELGTAETVAIDLVLAEFEARCKAGASADPEEIARRFPAHADEVRRAARRETTRATANVPFGSTHPEAGPPPAAPSPLPQQFGRYRILQKLGEGGMGSVYLAHDDQLDRPVALKVPHFTGDDRPQALERFRREARAAATIDHPNICPVYDVSEQDGTHYVSMAYIEGKPLSELIRGDKLLPPRTAAMLVRKIALALEEAHRKGVVHRDLKPSNVMVNKRNEPVVMDFGLATRQGDIRLTAPGSFLGTPAYMAPEQVQGDVAAMGPCCDIYSLGVILFECLTGQLPFRGSLAEVVGKILTQESPRPTALRSGLDPELEAVCLKAMAKKVPERFPTMKEFAAALTRWLKKNEGTPAPTPPVPVAQVAPSLPVASVLSEADPDRTERLATAPAARGSSAWPWIAAAAVLLGVLVFVVIKIVDRPVDSSRNGTPIVVGTTVQVQLQLSKTMDDTSVAYFLDGVPLARQKLFRPVELEPGDHTLEGKKNGVTVETFRFTVSKEDQGKKFPITPIENQPGNLPAHVEWDRRGLTDHFEIIKETYDHRGREIVWVLQVLRNNTRTQPLFGDREEFSARFLDADNVRIDDVDLKFQPGGVLQKGDRARATLSCTRPGDDLLKRAKRVLILGPTR